LSASFIESGWDVNKIIKLMVTSETYKQSSLASREDYINDPQNRLLSRGSRYRLDAEVIRDQNLFLSGLLNSQYGGPSVKPPQPSGLWEAVAFSSSNTGKFKASTGDQVYKRSVYTFWKRTSPPPQMTILDAPSRENCSVRRERTNTPMAALMLMNEKQNVEISITLARLALSYKNLDNEARLQKVFKKMFTRQLTKSETKSLLQALTLFKDEYKKHPKDAQKLFKNPKEEHVLEKAAWFLLMNSLINLDELITRQ
jgi:hypothetical protein